ncbi:MAG: tRNA (guanosine(37)-N1)-methyltransferase TrmD [Clostridia bacterium]|nr:tRNA (guanosine(37)-N1)-methyltransferase TrmD [Clostridia bacterium]
MQIDILTLFPEMCETVLNESIIGRAQKNGLVEIRCHNIRNYTTNKHGRVDDYPYGGGMGMVMAAQPIYDCCQAVTNGEKSHIIYMSPKGTVLTQQKARELATKERITILCGHYEGVDQRVLDEIVDEEISIGDYVLTGGELPALVLTDTVCRMLDGVLSSPTCFTEESFFSNRLEYPQYTRPEVWHDLKVPEVLLSGHHENIRQWREAQSLEITQKLRPDLLKDKS